MPKYQEFLMDMKDFFFSFICYSFFLSHCKICDFYLCAAYFIFVRGVNVYFRLTVSEVQFTII